MFNSVKNRELCVYDATISSKIEKHKMVQVRDHINNTGRNILIGHQKTVNIDFIFYSKYIDFTVRTVP